MSSESPSYDRGECLTVLTHAPAEVVREFVEELLDRETRPRVMRVSLQGFEERDTEQAVEGVHADLAVGPVVHRAPAEPVAILESPKDLLDVLRAAVGGDHLFGRPRQAVGDQDGASEPFREDPLEAALIEVKLEPAVAGLTAPLPVDEFRQKVRGEPARDPAADDGLGQATAGLLQLACESTQGLEGLGQRRRQTVQLFTGEGRRVLEDAKILVAMHDRAAGMWSVSAFDADTRFFLLDGGFVLATPEGRLLLCAADDASCAVPQRAIPTMGKSAHPPTAVLKYRNDLIVATREGRVLRFDLRKSVWKTILDIPERWRKPHPAHAALAGRSLWIARDNHLFRYQFAIGKHKIQHITSDKPLQGSEPLRLCAPQENSAVVVTDTHAHLFTGKSRVSAALPRSRGTIIATPCSHRDGVVWTAVSSLQSAPGALLRLDLKRKSVSATPFPRQDITVYDLEPDGDIIWLGTSAGALRMSLGQDPPLLRPLGGE